MDKYKVSIIIPVYNSAEYLRECIDSVLCQNYKNIELILVNDGSTDSSKKIIDNYKKKHPTIIKVFHLENSGVSNARNLGLKESTGSLITFVDADDVISTTYIEKLVSPFSEEYDKLCMSVGHMTLVYTDNSDFTERVESTEFETECTAGELLNELSVSRGGGYVWNKIFRHDLLIQNNIFFDPNIAITEDFLFCVQYLDACAGYNIRISNDYGYYYIQRNSSAIHQNKRDFGKVRALEKVLEISKKYPKLNRAIQKDYANHLVSVAFFYGKLSREYFKEIHYNIEYYSNTDFLTWKHRFMLAVGCCFPKIIILFRALKSF